MHGFEREDDKATCHSTLTGWTPSGKRVKRGMYRTGTGKFINADLNCAANILKKVERQLDLCLVKVCRQVLTLATRFRIWETKTKKRKEVALALPVTTV
jgi:putative transposase